MIPLHTPPGAAGAVVVAAVAAFVILLVAFIAATAVIARPQPRSRPPGLPPARPHRWAAGPHRRPPARRNPVTTGTTPGTPPARPATEWMKGARTAHDLITRQVEAGHSADRIAEQWDQALATYDDATATPAQREWHAGAEE